MEVFGFLRYLTENRTSRGLGGHELIECPELLALATVTVHAEGTSPQARATALRELLRQRYPVRPDRAVEPDVNLATLHLLGLSGAGMRQSTSVLRALAAAALRVSKETMLRPAASSEFQGWSAADLLLLDVADELWCLSEELDRAQ